MSQLSLWKAHKKPWQTDKVDPKIRTSTTPGAVVSIDQLESPVPGFIPIAKDNQQQVATE